MKSIKLKAAAALISAFLLVSCQNPAGGDNNNENSGNGNQNTPKTEYTVTFDNNCPAAIDGGNYYSCNEPVPAFVQKEEGVFITLPDFTGELTKYVNYEEEGIYPFEKWNTASDGTGDSYLAGASYEVTADITFYAVYSTEKKDDGTAPSSSDGKTDFSKTTALSMKMNDSIGLVSEIDGETVWYVIQSGDDVVEITDKTLKAIGPGTAIVEASNFDDTKIWSCVITVTVEGFSGSTLDYKLIGRWEDDDSYLLFNSDNTGELKVYKNGSVIQECTFEWSTYEDSIGKHLKLENCSADYIEEKSPYTITSISATTLKLHGYLAFGAAQDTTWTKQ